MTRPLPRKQSASPRVGDALRHHTAEADGEPTGVYIHVPFCARKCGYCSFVSARPAPGQVERYLAALTREIELRLGGLPVRTLYVGGGTPPLLPQSAWRRLMDGLRGVANLSGLLEATVEVNPGTIDSAYLCALGDAGFDRLSIGLQSTDDAVLRTLGRLHGRAEGLHALRVAGETGFEEVCVDLIYGVSGQTTEGWLKTLDDVLILNPRHISCYELTLEAGTPMERAVASGELEGPREETCREMHLAAHDLLTGEGYLHYEVSSYAMAEESISLHNSSYWEGRPYAGLGPAAHSFDGRRTRSWNSADTGAYCGLLEKGECPTAGSEVLTPRETALERLMLGLRWRGGVEPRELMCMEDIEVTERFSRMTDGLVRAGLLRREGDAIRPTRAGILLADRIALELHSALETELSREAPLRLTGRKPLL